MGASYIPLAFTLGLLAVQQGLSPWVAALMSAIVFAGASQFAALAMLRAERKWVLALARDVASGQLAWPRPQPQDAAERS